MYVSQEREPKLSMYSNWQILPPHDELLKLTTPKKLISAHDSRQWRYKIGRAHYTFAPSLKSVSDNQDGDSLLTHSNYWKSRQKEEEIAKNKIKIIEMKRKLNNVSDNSITSFLFHNMSLFLIFVLFLTITLSVIFIDSIIFESQISNHQNGLAIFYSNFIFILYFLKKKIELNAHPCHCHEFSLPQLQLQPPPPLLLLHLLFLL